MTVIMAMKAIKPKGALSSASVRARILNALKEEGKAMKKTLEDDVCGTWNHKPGFTEPHVQYRGGDAIIAVATGDPIFHYLNVGTAVRYAKLSKNWTSKTKTSGSLRSGTNQGKAYKTRVPHKGIDARDFTGRVARKHEATLRIKVKDAISKGLGTP